MTHSTFYKTENTIDSLAVITCMWQHFPDECGFIQLKKDYGDKTVSALESLPETKRAIKLLEIHFTYTNFLKDWGNRIGGLVRCLRGKPFEIDFEIDTDTRAAWGKWMASDLEAIEPTPDFNSNQFVINNEIELTSGRFYPEANLEVIQIAFLTNTFPLKKRIKFGWEHFIKLDVLYVPIYLNLDERLKLAYWLLKSSEKN